MEIPSLRTRYSSLLIEISPTSIIFCPLENLDLLKTASILAISSGNENGFVILDYRMPKEDIEDIKNYHKLVEKLELAKKKGTPIDDRGPGDLTKKIEILDYTRVVGIYEFGYLRLH